jgi:hypothetical protein
MLLTFQIPQLYIYDVENKTENQLDLEAPIGYYINRVSFIDLYN